MEQKRIKKVYVGLSGGVDSSVVAALLKDAGYDVTGVFIRTWQPDFVDCTFREDRLDAMRVAAHLDIPFLECDAEAHYKQAVADYMIEEYRQGRTPNPDILCNREIKFGVFWQFAKSMGADAIATGHYAQNIDTQLVCGTDTSKDQVYFLYRLTRADLEHTLFPLGSLSKDTVRALAKKYGLPTARKKDSQGVCMLGDLDIKEFLGHYIESKRGDVLDEYGAVIGHHDGAVFLTLGERHGFTITKKTPNDERYYIVAKNIGDNTITVASTLPSREESYSNILKNIRICQASWVGDAPVAGKKYTAQIRYHGDFLPCAISGNEVIFDLPVLVAPGQSVVLYDGNVCLGGGVVL